MIPHYNKIHNKFRLNGAAYNRQGLKEVAYSYIKEGASFERSIGQFLQDWLDDHDYIVVKTSGSTGAPKQIKRKKLAMVRSAIMTGDYFKLKPGNSALLCLSSVFIAGKMMLVRSIILGLELDVVAPVSNPFISVKKSYDFCAMVPLQVASSLPNLNQIKTLIIGGAPVSERLKEMLQNLKTSAFLTYGMTETITHVAVKKLNHQQKKMLNLTENSLFHVLPNITISQDDRDCLVIEAPHLFEGKVITNDIVKLDDSASFEFLGRYDHVINSGGVKLFPEQIERKLSKLINKRFFIASESDDRLGERVILILEGDAADMETTVFNVLTKFEKPKGVYNIKQFTETTSGKIDRKVTLNSLKKGLN